MELADTLDGAVSPVQNPNLFGHDEALSFLGHAYKSAKSHHAFLIEGPEGIGKATLAFRFAHHILAHPEPEMAPDVIGVPDTEALSYKQVVAGASHNLLHLRRPYDEKAERFKSAITVDEVRRTGRFFGQTSGSQNWRIVIVDAADDLNRSAANAILKMLEEPPKRSLFLVLSHAPGRLLPTIRSRCLPLVLKPLSDDNLMRALESLGLAIDDDERVHLIQEANGSVSEAIRLINYGGLEILKAIDAVLTDPDGQRGQMHKISDTLAARDNDALFDLISALLLRRLELAARNSALGGDIEHSAKIANLVSDLRDRLTNASAFNLDKKQMALSLIESCQGIL